MVSSVQYIVCSDDAHGQRLDNFLISRFKSVPKSRIYRAIRSGEVRVNKSRSKQTTRLACGDVVRVPPFKVSDSSFSSISVPKIDINILYESDDYLILDKPSGVPVHSGTDAQYGLIDSLHCHYDKGLYLVHRLDKDVSGCLLLAKSRHALNVIQSIWSSEHVAKVYHAVVFYDTIPEFTSICGDLMSESGRTQSAKTEFSVLERFRDCLLLEVRLHSGRKHQIRKHLASVGLPLVGDKKYGDFTKNRFFLDSGLLLHARKLTVDCDAVRFSCAADYPSIYQRFIDDLFAG